MKILKTRLAPLMRGFAAKSLRYQRAAFALRHFDLASGTMIWLARVGRIAVLARYPQPVLVAIRICAVADGPVGMTTARGRG